MTALPGAPRRRRLAVCALLVLPALAAGCVTPLMTDYRSGSRRRDAEDAAHRESAPDSTADVHDAKAAALRKATADHEMTDEEALAGVLDELQEIGAIDPAARIQLLSDLKAAKPEHYELVATQFKAALDYRRQLAAREILASSEAASDNALVATAEGNAARVVTQHATPPAPEAVEPAVAEYDHAAPVAPAVVTAPMTKDHSVLPATAISTQGGDRRTPLAAVLPSPPAGDWRTQLDASIAALERSVPPQPTTVEELHEHFRLRALQLLAGREQDAYRPIPGASSVQHDYWSKQLFAISTFLNDDAARDDKQRAAAALVQLDGARGALAELATLQIRNLAFVENVDGFGAYTPLKRTQFDPGATVSLYAEVENFASVSTAEGYQTILASSYQVVDGAGRRIDGAPFPDVTDVCRGRRRDFHLQYGVTLPTRISPGQYRLELTMTDQRSGKIGHAQIDFEINAER